MKIKIKTKRQIYIFLVIILGVLLGVISWAFFVLTHINDSLVMGTAPEELPQGILGIFIVAGVMLGYVLGVRWWQIVYVEKRHWRKLR